VNLQEIIEKLQLQCLTEDKDFSQVVPTSGYVSDLLSCAMSGAQQGALWVTIQSHMNIVAVAALLDLSAIVISEDSAPDTATIAKANEEGVVLLLSEKSIFHVAGRLWEMGLRDS